MSGVVLKPAADFPLPRLAELFNRSFEGYFVPIHDTAEALAARLRFDSTDLAASRVALDGGEPVGLIYLSPRGWSCRVAGMGVVKRLRRRGVGQLLMDDAIARLRDAGFRRLVLEVIAENEPAVALYRGLGFETRRRLVGFELDARKEPGPPDAENLEGADPRELARLVDSEAEPDLPWQLAAESLSALGPPGHTYRSAAGAWAALGLPAAETAVLHALLVPRALRRRGLGRGLFGALCARHPGRRWRVPARVPEELAAEFFTALGFTRSALSQWEMELVLSGGQGA